MTSSSYCSNFCQKESRMAKIWVEMFKIRTIQNDHNDKNDQNPTTIGKVMTFLSYCITVAE